MRVATREELDKESFSNLLGSELLFSLLIFKIPTSYTFANPLRIIDSIQKAGLQLWLF